jgi:hypothetical protein
MPKGNKDRKTTAVSAVIGALCIVLYIGALSYGALAIYNSITSRRALGDREFNGLADLAAAAGVLGFDERFFQTIQDAIDGSETILGAVISGSRGEFAFQRKGETVISWVNNSPRFAARFGVTNPPNSTYLQIQGQRNATIQVVSSYLDYDFCIETLKRTLLAVLFSLALAFFTLLMDALLAKNGASPAKAPAETPVPGAAPGGEEDSGEEKGPPRQELDLPDSPGEEKPGGSPAEMGLPSGKWGDFDFDDDDDFPDFSGDGDPETPAFPPGKEAALPEAEEPGPVVPAETPAPEPQGLFSPRGNVGWESYTEDRLESELRRCASAEQDLTLLVMSFKEPERLNKEQFRRFCEEAVSYFGHRDLIFEYGDQGLWIIRPNHGLEQDLTTVEEFTSRVFSKMPKAAGSKLDLRSGLSSRSGRLIDAERIMLEAGEALKRAVEDPASRVVAFKSDPEKYRQYISGLNHRSA